MITSPVARRRVQRAVDHRPTIGIAEICAETRLARRTVMRALADLRAMGWRDPRPRAQPDQWRTKEPDHGPSVIGQGSDAHRQDAG